MVFVSGQLGLDGNDEIVAGGIGPETRQCLQNLKAVPAHAGAGLDDVTMVNVYMKDQAYSEPSLIVRRSSSSLGVAR